MLHVKEYSFTNLCVVNSKQYDVNFGKVWLSSVYKNVVTEIVLEIPFASLIIRNKVNEAAVLYFHSTTCVANLQ
jgi:hypothetical protein